MSMETSNATAAPHPVGKNGTVARKQSGGSDDSSAPGAPTFRSLLTTMDSEASPDPQAQAAPVVEVPTAAPPNLLPPDASVLLAQNPNRAVKLEDSDVAVLPDPGALAGVPGRMAVAPGLVDQADALVAGGRAAREPEKSTDKTDLVGAGRKPAGFPVATDLAADTVTTPSDTSQHASNTPAMLRRADVDRAAQEAGTWSSAKATQARLNESRLAAEGAQADWRATITAKGENMSVTGAPMANALGALSRGVAIERDADRPAPRPLFVPAGSALAGSWAEPAMSGGSPATGATFAPHAATPVPETAVAEKLNYWISRGVQNAELQLDAFGGGSVEVSISVHGKEAQVEFRSDQPEARKLLQDAMPQLRDMLKTEGLELSGGFVGTSAQHDPGARERRSNAQGVRSSVVSVEAQVADGTPGLSRVPGRSVDLFV